MRRSNKKIGKFLSSTGRNPNSAAPYKGTPRDCSTPLRQEESEAGRIRGIQIYQKLGPGLNPNTHANKQVFDMAADNAYHAVYPDAPKHIPHANHQCAYAWLRIRNAVANSYRKTVIQNHGASGGPSVNYGYKGADNKPVFDQRYMSNGASFSSTGTMQISSGSIMSASPSRAGDSKVKSALQKLKAMGYTIHDNIWRNFQRDFQIMHKFGMISGAYPQVNNVPDPGTLDAVNRAYSYEKNHGKGSWVMHVKKLQTPETKGSPAPRPESKGSPAPRPRPSPRPKPRSSTPTARSGKKRTRARRW